MSHGKPYSIYRRGHYFYARFKLPSGKWSTGKSTSETAKGRAERWAIDYLSAGQIITKEYITFKDFSNNFFNWEGAWATDKRARGLRVSPRHCQERADLLKNHIYPAMGKLYLSSIDRMTIKNYRNDLFLRGYSGSTINKILSTIKAILESAEEQSLIKFIPRIDR